jgi:hypothetical protein
LRDAEIDRDPARNGAVHGAAAALMAKGFLYLVVVIMDWVSRAVLVWRLSNTLGAECVEALEEALSRHGRPEIHKRMFFSGVKG